MRTFYIGIPLKAAVSWVVFSKPMSYISSDEYLYLKKFQRTMHNNERQFRLLMTVVGT